MWGEELGIDGKLPGALPDLTRALHELASLTHSWSGQSWPEWGGRSGVGKGVSSKLAERSSSVANSLPPVT
jgi:hypothetical protein